MMKGLKGVVSSLVIIVTLLEATPMYWLAERWKEEILP
jgi:hypothetical protein